MDAALVGHEAAKTAIDVACWDAHGKSAAMPVCDLLGGRIEAPVPVISSVGNTEAIRASVTAHRAAGFMGHSVKIGASDAEGGPALDADGSPPVLPTASPANGFFRRQWRGDTGSRAAQWHLRRHGHRDRGALRKLARDSFASLAPPASHLLDELIQSDADLIHAIATDACGRVGLKISKQGRLTPCSASVPRHRGRHGHVGPDHHRIGDFLRRHSASGAFDAASPAAPRA